MSKLTVTAAAVFFTAFTIVLTNAPTAALAPPTAVSNFEGSQTNPIRLSADNTRLFAVNTPNSTVSVFDVTNPSSPVLLSEIPVGLEPVSVNPVSDDLAWVVNQASASVSIVSVAQGIVTATINLKSLSNDTALSEPSDVVFAGGQAYVSVSRSNVIAVFDQTTLLPIAMVPVLGGNPRAMAVSPDGGTVYAAFAMAGDATTIIKYQDAPPQPPPTNPALPPPPQAGLIVSATDPTWKKYIRYQMPDNGVAAIQVGAKPKVTRYYSGVGTINLGLGVNPVTGDLFVANTEALNLTHFVNNLCGHFVNNRITRIQVSGGSIAAFDLNPNVEYGCSSNPTDLSIALAQPAGVTFDPSGEFMYVAAFGTDRIAKVDTNGNVISFVEVAPASGSGSNVDPANKRGPRACALIPNANTLYCLNRLSDSISIIDTATSTLANEIAVGSDPTPAALKQGRGFLYDAKLSGTGTGSCASCHVDGDMDHLAWDLGNPSGNMIIVQQNGHQFAEHPMKGPMTTLSLRGLLNVAPLDWRGDEPSLQAFKTKFPALLGGPEVTDTDVQRFATFALTIQELPNPYLNLDRTLPARKILGGNAVQGQSVFTTLPESYGETCESCHGHPRIVSHGFGPQDMQTPSLRNVYQKLLFTPNQKKTIDGFGLFNDGQISTIHDFLKRFPKYTSAQRADLAAFEVCYDTGTAPAVGYTITVQGAAVNKPSAQKDWVTLESEAGKGDIDLIVRGTVGGLLYQPATNLYTGSSGETYTHAQLQMLVQQGATATIMGVVPGTGSAAIVRR